MFLNVLKYCLNYIFQKNTDLTTKRVMTYNSLKKIIKLLYVKI